jgi:ComF family protein
MMIDWLLGMVSPHICKGCGKAGSGLCVECFNDIIDTDYGRCLHCEELTTIDNLCRNCQAKLPFDRAFVVGPRRGVLRRLVGDFKFNSERGQAREIVKLLDAVLPILPNGTVVVPIPTIAPHIRRRGFGHTELVARLFAHKRKMRSDNRILKRITSSVQHGLTASERAKQADQAFLVNRHKIMPQERLLIDDIYTTGATVIAASKLLKQTGVQTINVAIIARHVREQ